MEGPSGVEPDLGRRRGGGSRYNAHITISPELHHAQSAKARQLIRASAQWFPLCCYCKY